MAGHLSCDLLLLCLAMQKLEKRSRLLGYDRVLRVLIQILIDAGPGLISRT